VEYRRGGTAVHRGRAESGGELSGGVQVRAGDGPDMEADRKLRSAADDIFYRPAYPDGISGPDLESRIDPLCDGFDVHSDQIFEQGTFLLGQVHQDAQVMCLSIIAGGIKQAQRKPEFRE